MQLFPLTAGQLAFLDYPASTEPEYSLTASMWQSASDPLVASMSNHMDIAPAAFRASVVNRRRIDATRATVREWRRQQLRERVHGTASSTKDRDARIAKARRQLAALDSKGSGTEIPTTPVRSGPTMRVVPYKAKTDRVTLPG